MHISEPHQRLKFRLLWNDLLIALCALRLGAVLFTYDGQDFELVRRYVAFKFVT
jgi:predicted nucleic acid-binding protein